MKLRSITPCMLLVIQAVSLLCFQPASSSTSLGNETDLLALLKFKDQIADNQRGILNSWNSSIHFCSWPGITCGRRHQRVVALVLKGNNLRGSISPYIGNLTFLKKFSLANNSFRGQIPRELGHLNRLRWLTLANNTLGGEIPVDLLNCTKLNFLSLFGNMISGEIPNELGSLVELRIFTVGHNNLSGVIPSSIGNISSLELLDIHGNFVGGRIPEEMGSLKMLSEIEGSINKLSGTIPSSLYNMSSINFLYLAENQLEGTLPNSTGLTLLSLVEFSIYQNQFVGSIPFSFSNASRLQVLDLGFNNFTGAVPLNLGRLIELSWLNVAANYLGGYSTHDLDFLVSLTNCSKLEVLQFSVNKFEGILPDSVVNLSASITMLMFHKNYISGSIHSEMGNLHGLSFLTTERNLLSGTIPHSLGKLKNLKGLYLGRNQFTGEIPSSIGNLTELIELSVTDNRLEGSIPSSLGDCKKLLLVDISRNNLTGLVPSTVIGLLPDIVSLNLSYNSLRGNLPVDVGKLKSINALDLSQNNFSGVLPGAISGCLSLEFLFLEGNSFLGAIPSSLASLKGIRFLDLSQNKFSGQIPNLLQSLAGLEYLNLSLNNLEGEVPTKGLFQNSSRFSIAGNPKLCGGISELQLPACPSERTGQRKSHALKLALEVLCSVLGISVLLFGILCWKRQANPGTFTSPTIELLSRVSYKTLYDATEGFSRGKLIGSGSFGSVYKGVLEHGEIVAIKVFNLQIIGASRSFKRECEALRAIRHRNVVKILTCCFGVDFKGNDFKALVLELMENGSLEKWLHTPPEAEDHSRKLTLLQRVNIAADIASAIHHLHEYSGSPIIHCDIKPNNVLLDEDMVAHVNDFGLARLVPVDDDHSKSQTSTVGLKGTVGYAPPEYGVGGQASKEGDVYSFGVLVMEMFTRKRPTDEMFRDGFSLHHLVKGATSSSELLAQVIDPTILMGEEEKEAEEEDGENEIQATEGSSRRPVKMTSEMRKCLLSVLNIGIACTMESPRERMIIGDAVREFHKIKNQCLRTGNH